MAHICKSQNLGSTNGLRQTKVEWRNNGPFGIPTPTLYCRDTLYAAYVELCGPDDVLEAMWTDVRDCINVGLGAATLAAIFASPSVALPAFETGFKGCLVAKVGARIDEIQVQLSTRDETGDWGAC